MRKITGFISILTIAAFIAGCQQPVGPSVSRGSVGQAQRVDEGEIIMVQFVTIEGKQNLLGTLGGGVVGYAVGNTVGGGSGKDLARAVGAVGGAVAGGAVQKKATTQQGVEITVQLENGEVVSVTQKADQTFNVGDQVRVLRRGSSARVMQ